jgi:phosphoribosyl 1,2-cyclic phosphodiesterase
MNLTQTTLATNLSYIPANEPHIEICFGGVSPLGPLNGLTTCYGIYIPANKIDPSVGIIIDNGTGIHNVMKFMDKRKPERMVLLQTHLHVDHIIGVLFNKYLFGMLENTTCLITEYALAEMNRLVSPPLHPIAMRFVGPSNLPSFQKYGVKITDYELPHGSDVSTGFRIEALGKVIVVATDCELRTPEDQRKFAQWSKDAGMLVLDMKYASEETYRVGHGHNHPGLIHKTLGHWSNASNVDAKTHLALVHRDGPSVPHDFIESVLTPGMRIASHNAVSRVSMPDDGDIISF